MLGDRYEHFGCDRDVRVGRTMLTGADGQRLKMFGAFAGRDFMPFEFLGFYTGDLLEFEDGKSPGIARAHARWNLTLGAVGFRFRCVRSLDSEVFDGL